MLSKANGQLHKTIVCRKEGFFYHFYWLFHIIGSHQISSNSGLAPILSLACLLTTGTHGHKHAGEHIYEPYRGLSICNNDLETLPNSISDLRLVTLYFIVAVGPLLGGRTHASHAEGLGSVTIAKKKSCFQLIWFLMARFSKDQTQCNLTFYTCPSI